MRQGRKLVVAAVMVGAWLALATPARAQVCGDADDSGTVTVTDGVQTLRAAAGLSTTCAAGRCDVDGSGAITVSDGVNVLRKAAGISITEACAGTSVTATVRGVLGEMTKIARVPVAASAALAARTGVQPAITTDCNDGGFIEVEGETSTFHDCRFGTLLINGAVTTTNVLSDPENQHFIRSDLYESYEVRFTDSDFTYRQDGASRIEIDTKNDKLIEDSTVTITTAESATGQDEYVLKKVNLTTSLSTGVVMNGQLITALAQAGLANIKTVTLGFVVGTVADVDVEFDDGHTEAFKYDIQTGELTPASLARLERWLARREREELDAPRGSRTV